MRVFYGHAVRDVPEDAQAVIHSAAVGANNPELRQAREHGLPVFSYPEAFGQLTRDSLGLVIAGTHGKSTTTAMLAQILIDSGVDPTVVLGAKPIGWKSGGRAGAGGVTLVEGCEYRESFLQLWPRAAALLNVEPDHFDCFPRIEQALAAYGRFVRRVPPDGCLLANADCRGVRRVVAAAGRPFVTFGLGAGCQWRAQGLRSVAGRFRFSVFYRRRKFAEVCLSQPGLHQVYNALAAAAMAGALGLAGRQVGQSLAGFAGVKRRLEVVGTFGGVTVVDDYAHHPTEVSASLAALRAMFPNRRLGLLFQPHQALRTSRLLDGFASSLQNADSVVIADVFCA